MSDPLVLFGERARLRLEFATVAEILEKIQTAPSRNFEFAKDENPGIGGLVHLLLNIVGTPDTQGRHTRHALRKAAYKAKKEDNVENFKKVLNFHLKKLKTRLARHTLIKKQATRESHWLTAINNVHQGKPANSQSGHEFYEYKAHSHKIPALDGTKISFKPGHRFGIKKTGTLYHLIKRGLGPKRLDKETTQDLLKSSKPYVPGKPEQG